MKNRYYEHISSSKTYISLFTIKNTYEGGQIVCCESPVQLSFVNFFRIFLWSSSFR